MHSLQDDLFNWSECTTRSDLILKTWSDQTFSNLLSGHRFYTQVKISQLVNKMCSQQVCIASLSTSCNNAVRDAVI